MKIALLTSSYPRFPGDGAAPFVKSIAENLVACGHQVFVIAPYDPEIKKAPAQTGGVPVHRFRYTFIESWNIMGHAKALESDAKLRPLAFLLLPFYLLSALTALLKVIREQHADMIYAHWVIPGGFVASIASWLTKTPFILSLHGSDIFVARRSLVYKPFVRWVFKRATAITACSPDLRAGAIALGADPDRVHLLPWGADPSIFHPNRRTVPSLAETSPVPQPIQIYALGRFVYKKGFELLIKALPAVLEQHPNVRVVIGGDGPLRSLYLELAKQNGIAGQIAFPGKIPWDKVPEFLANADIFVLPSIKDAFGNQDGLPTVLLEAMSCGCAVVASDLGGVSLVVQDQKNGFLVEPGDIQALSNLLNHLVEHPEEIRSTGSEARKSVEQTYNWRNVAGQITRLMAIPTPKNTATRMGTIYRDEILTLLSLKPDHGKVLDVGCHDGHILHLLTGAGTRIGVDLEPEPVFPEISYLAADGCLLPFTADSFDYVYALDVIEHIPQDGLFAESLQRVVKPDGVLFVSTPSEKIRMFPAFLTGWISRKWGHDLRRGYSPETLNRFFHWSHQTKTWNAPYWRFFYLPLRLIYGVFPNRCETWVRKIARWDYRRQDGQNGYYFVILQKDPANLRQESQSKPL